MSETRTLFDLGQVCATPGALEIMTMPQIINLVARHACGDFGEIDVHDRKENELSIREGFRILSAYTVNGHGFFVITEADRSSTCVLLKSEY